MPEVNAPFGWMLGVVQIEPTGEKRLQFHIESLYGPLDFFFIKDGAQKLRDSLEEMLPLLEGSGIATPQKPRLIVPEGGDNGSH